MNTSGLTLQSPHQFTQLKAARNRVIVAPMASGTASPSGQVTPLTLSHYERLTLARAGLVFVEYSYVHRSGRSEDNQLGIDQDDQLAGLKKLSGLIRGSGALAFIQLTHAGGKSSRSLTDGSLPSPSGVRVPVKDRELEVPDSMSREDIKDWRKLFRAAVRRAVMAGFDGVEFHSAHGYGLNQWLSPITNRRTDEYGGSLENRSRLLSELVADARLAYPDLLISVRFPGQDFSECGLTVEEMCTVAKKMESQGVNLLNVSSGVGGWRRPSDRPEEGYLVPEAAQIQAAIKIPVAGVGGIQNQFYINEQLKRRSFAFATVGRAILKDPQAWGEAI